MSNEQSLFSSTGEDVLNRQADIDSDGIYDTSTLDPTSSEFEEYFAIERTVQDILEGNYSKIALQFPDPLLCHSVPVFKALQSRLGAEREIYVLADTSYGSCCVDEVAAQHVSADVMVHYGHACMSKPYRLPVIYVFGQASLDIDDCVDRLMEALKSASISSDEFKSVTLKHDVFYTHHADSLLARLQHALDTKIDLIYHRIPLKLEPDTKTAPSHYADERGANLELDDNTLVFYIGRESLSLTHLLMTNPSNQVYSYNPKTKAIIPESLRTNKLLMRRYVAVQKARDADVFGIIVGTLGVASYLPLISRIRQLLKQKQKKSYTISVGKLNPAKLANFLEIECFVLVACPENSVIEAKDFHRPIVTPYELEVALQANQPWGTRYVLDFDQLLTDAHQSEQDQTRDNSNEDSDPDQPVFSLVTGKYRHAKRFDKDTTIDTTPADNTSAVILRSQDNTLTKFEDSAAAQYLQGRSYQGLEARIGMDAPSVLEQGRAGIAKGYQDDHGSTHEDKP